MVRAYDAGAGAAVVGHLPAGATEIYFHPAAARDKMLARLMPDYEHVAELEALLSLAQDSSVVNGG
jgi:hypothetical protein